MKTINVLKFVSSLLLGLSLETIYASSPNPAIADQIGKDLASLQNLVGDISPISQLNYPLTNFSSMPGFLFGFENSNSSDIVEYAFVESTLNNPTALYQKFDWSIVLEAIQNGGVYITLLVFDTNNKFVNVANNTEGVLVENIALVIYDHTGKILSGMPLIFPAAYATNSKNKDLTQKMPFASIDFLLYDQSNMYTASTISNYPFLLAFNTPSNNLPANNNVSNNPVIKTLKLIKAVSDIENNPVTKTLKLIKAVENNKIISQLGTNLDDLYNLTGNIANISNVKYSLSSLSSMPGFNFNFSNTGNTGYTNYAFILPFPNSEVSFTALHNTSYDTFDWGTVLQTINTSGAYLTLLAFDENNQLITSVINSETANFNKLLLAIYDNTGTMINGMPLVIPAGNADQNGGYQSIENILFALYNSGDILIESTITNYPFLIALNIISPDAVANSLDLAKAVFQNLNFGYSALSELTLAQLQTKITLNSSSITSDIAYKTIPGWAGNGNGWALSINQMNGGSGYAFINDPWNSYSTTTFSGTSGLATNVNAASIESTMICPPMRQPIPCGSCSMVLLGFDENNLYIPDIITSAPTYFGLFMYNANGDLLSGLPVQFSPKNYVGLGDYQIKQGVQGPAQFTLSGLGLQSNAILTYPFNLKINWRFIPE